MDVREIPYWEAHRIRTKAAFLRRPQYLLRVHMIDYQKLVLSIAVPLIGVLLFAWLVYKLVRSKWLRSWWAAPSS